MNILKSFVILCVLCLLTPTLAAQSKKPSKVAAYGSISGKVYLSNNSGELLDASNANITIIANRDTLHTATFREQFLFKKVPAGKAKILVSLVGYKTTIRDITVEAGKTTNYDFELKEQSLLLKEVVVKGKASPASLHGDTIMYNPKAVFVQEGDMAMDIVRQMPGVKVENGVVTVMGKEIKKTYVDGKLVFGRDPLNALNNLSATDVTQIRAFDEFDNKNSRKKLLQGEKVRVFNISTKSHLVNSFDTQLLGSAGSNIGHNDKGAFRKGAGITSNFFSEKYLFSLNAFHNNMSRRSNDVREILSILDPGNTYKESTYIAAATEYNWDKENGTNGSIHLGYNFGLDKSDTDSRNEQNYFADANYNSRVYAITSQQHQIDRLHNVTLDINNNNDKWGCLMWYQSFQFNNSDSHMLNETSNTVDGHILSRNALRNDGKNKFSNISESFIYMKTLSTRFRLNINGQFTNRKGNDEMQRLDSLQAPATYTYLTIPAHTRDTQANCKLGVYWFPKGNGSSLNLSAGANYTDGYRHQFAWNINDIANPTIDENNTYSYKNHSMEYNQELSFYLSLSQNRERTFDASAGMKETTVKRDEVKWDNYRKTFISPDIELKYEDKNISHSYKITYKLSSILPNIEQLRPQINNKDPYLLSCGNSGLKQSYDHSFLISTQQFLNGGKNIIGGFIDCGFRQNSISNKSTYFTKATYLPEQNYTAPAGSTLNSFTNIQGAWYIKSNVSWEHALLALKSRYMLIASYKHVNLPFFVGDSRFISRSDAPSLIQQLSGTPTRNIRWKFAETTQYNFYSGDNSSRNFVQTVNCSLTMNNIFKVCYFNMGYQFTFNRTYGNASSTNSMNILNINLGCKVLKRKGDITFSAYDILGSHNNFATKVLGNYVLNQWTNYYGRYFSINFAYHFGKVKSQYKGMLNNGAIR